MTPSPALVDYQAIARYLGEPYYITLRPYGTEHGMYDGRTGGPVSDADLCIAVLENLARDNRFPSLRCVRTPDRPHDWEIELQEEAFIFYEASPILAISALVVALEKP